MEFSFDPGSASYHIKSYQKGILTLNVKTKQETYKLPLVIMPEQLLTTWGPESFEDLKIEHFQKLLEFKPQVVLLGTGEKMRFLKPELFACLSKQNIGIEVMTTAAAARTYTILMSEGRNVAAALFP